MTCWDASNRKGKKFPIAWATSPMLIMMALQTVLDAAPWLYNEFRVNSNNHRVLI